MQNTVDVYIFGDREVTDLSILTTCQYNRNFALQINSLFQYAFFLAQGIKCCRNGIQIFADNLAFAIITKCGYLKNRWKGDPFTDSGNITMLVDADKWYGCNALVTDEVFFNVTILGVG